MKAAYDAVYTARGLYKAIAALRRVSVVPADFDRLVSSSRLIHVAIYRPHCCIGCIGWLAVASQVCFFCFSSRFLERNATPS